MADGMIQFTLDARKLMESFDLAPAESKRAAKQALRVMGRLLARAEKSAAPRQSGTLQRSVHQSKQIRVRGDDFTISVGPMGGKANLYRSKVEASKHFVTGALSSSAELDAAAQQVYEAAVERIVARRPSRDDG